jgi:hypothetical protein
MVREKPKRAKNSGVPLDRENRKRARRIVMENNEGMVSENTATATIDYEAEYKKMVAERDSFKAEAEKQKRMKDQYATENADYKKKADALLSDEEKRQKEHAELLEKSKNYEAELNKLKTEKEILANGFTAEESEILIKGGCSIELVKPLAEIIKARTTELEKTIKAQLLKETTQTSPMGNGTVGKQEKTGYQKYEESRQVGNQEVKL